MGNRIRGRKSSLSKFTGYCRHFLWNISHFPYATVELGHVSREAQWRTETGNIWIEPMDVFWRGASSLTLWMIPAKKRFFDKCPILPDFLFDSFAKAQSLLESNPCISTLMCYMILPLWPLRKIWFILFAFYSLLFYFVSFRSLLWCIGSFSI